MRIVASVALVAFSVATAPALADGLEWGPLSTQPKDNQNTIWDAHCKDGSEHVVSGRCTITDGSGTLQNVGINAREILGLACGDRRSRRLLARFAQNDFGKGGLADKAAWPACASSIFHFCNKLAPQSPYTCSTFEELGRRGWHAI
jgi:hypothetical protein